MTWPTYSAPGPEVQQHAPDREGDTEGLRHLGYPGAALGQQQQRERIEQAESRRLAEIVHRQRLVSVPTDDSKTDSEDDVPADDQGRDPPGNEIPDHECDQGGEDVQPIGRRIEQLAQLAVLPEEAGKFAVRPVGHGAEREHDQRPAVVGRVGQQQPEEQRNPEQPQERKQIRDRPDSM